MTLANEIAFGVRYLEGYINSFKFPGHTKDFKKWYLLPLCPTPDKSESGGNALALKKAQLIPCTVVLYDKEGTNQRAGCLRV